MNARERERVCVAHLTLMDIDRSRSEKQEENSEEDKKRSGDGGNERNKIPKPVVVVVAAALNSHFCIVMGLLSLRFVHSFPLIITNGKGQRNETDGA